MSYPNAGFRNPFGFTVTPWVKRLLIANGVVFLLTVAFAGLVHYLAFIPAEVLRQPWRVVTIVTYMFVHASFFHILFNMLGLFFFGPPLEERWGSAEFLKFYFICGAAGAALSFITPNYAIVGASAAVYGVLVAYAMYWPDNPIYIWGIFPVKAKWLVAFFIGISLFYALTGGAPGVAHFAHLGGAAAAFLYLKSDWGPSPWGPRPAQPRRRSQATVVSREESSGETISIRRRAPRRRPVEEERLLDDVDRILDKISERGLESLTEDERRVLDEASRRYRAN